MVADIPTKSAYQTTEKIILVVGDKGGYDSPLSSLANHPSIGKPRKKIESVTDEQADKRMQQSKKTIFTLKCFLLELLNVI
jgi:hypothetical protein